MSAAEMKWPCNFDFLFMKYIKAVRFLGNDEFTITDFNAA